jgi:hypothetical protein
MIPPLAFGPLTTSTWPLLVVAVAIWATVFARELSRGRLSDLARFVLLILLVAWLFCGGA